MTRKKRKSKKTNAIKKDSLLTFCRALKSHKRFLLSCHVTPEGDAIGSILAMNSLLKRLGKKTIVVAQDVFPDRLRGILSPKDWVVFSSLKGKKPRFDALVVADCPTLDRIGKVKTLVDPETVIFNIDHHVSNLRFGRYNYVLPDAAASGEVIYDIFKKMKVPIRKEDAVNLYVALTTDTGSFRQGSTTEKSHRVAADLVSKGIQIERINERLYSNYSLSKVHLYGRLFGRVKTASKGRVAWVHMTREDLKHSGATDEDAEGFVDLLKLLKEVRVAFFMIEQPRAYEIRVSFRAKGAYDVNRIATYFNGGGHKKASGCMIHGTLKEAEKLILDSISQEYKL